MQLDAIREDFQKHIDIINEELLQELSFVFILLLLTLGSAIENFKGR